jgi:hypothetical protein
MELGNGGLKKNFLKISGKINQSQPFPKRLLKGRQT